MTEENPFNLAPGQKKKIIFTKDGSNYSNEILERPIIKKQILTGEIIEKRCGTLTEEQQDNSKEAVQNQIRHFPTAGEVEYTNGKTILCTMDLKTGKHKSCQIYRSVKKDGEQKTDGLGRGREEEISDNS